MSEEEQDIMKDSMRGSGLKELGLSPAIVRTLLIACALLATGGPSFAAMKTSISWSRQEQAEIRKLAERVVFVDNMNQVENTNWTVRTAYSAQFTAEASYFMEMFSKALLDALFVSPEFALEMKPVLTIYATKEDYEKQEGAPPNSAGHFKRARLLGAGKWEWDLRLLVYVEKPRGTTGEPEFGECWLPVLQHEGAHAITQKILGGTKIPPWLNEGIARYYEFMDLTGPYKLSGATASMFDSRAREERTKRSFSPDWLKKHMKAHRDAPVGLKYLTSLTDYKVWNPDKLGATAFLHYSLSESFIDFLMASQKGRITLQQIMERVVKAERPLIPGADMVKMETEWHRHLTKTWRVKLPR